jgi:CheY-like chemotaxis protein
MTLTEVRAAPAATAQNGYAVLLVNDDPGTLFALRTVLGDLDAEIVTATSGEQALLRLLKQDFCVILMDVKMAGLDGFETARLVRSRPRSRATPIVLLTSHQASDLDRSHGYEVGASDYVFMPVAPEVLKAKVQAFIDGAAAAARTGDARRTPAVAPQDYASKPVDSGQLLAQLRVWLAGGN